MTYLPAAINEAELLPSSERVIWDAIVECAENILKTKGIRIYLYQSDSTQLLRLSLPSLKGWRLVEILCALTVLDRAEEIRGTEVRGIAGKVGPIEYRSSRGLRFLWTQPNMTEGRSGLTGRPDIIITDTPEKPSHHNAVRIIECKGVRKLGAQTIRAEFAKSYDLRVESYMMWSYYGVAKKVIEGARLLGINLSVIGLETKAGEARRNPETLRRHVADELERAETEQLFARNIRQAADEELEKLNRPNRLTS